MTSTGRTAKGGFTLIEIVVSLVLLGLLAGAVFNFAGRAVQGFFIARDAMEITQKAQIALNRMRSEFTYIDESSVSVTGTSTSISYRAEFPDGPEDNTIAYDAGAGTITLDGVILTDDVAGLTFQYFTGVTGAAGSTYTTGDIIGIILTMRDSDGTTVPFTTRIFPGMALL